MADVGDAGIMRLPVKSGRNHGMAFSTAGPIELCCRTYGRTAWDSQGQKLATIGAVNPSGTLMPGDRVGGSSKFIASGSEVGMDNYIRGPAGTSISRVRRVACDPMSAVPERPASTPADMFIGSTPAD